MAQLYFTNENGFVAVHLKTAEPVNAWQGRILATGAATARISSQGTEGIFWQTAPRSEGDSIIFSGGIIGGRTGDLILFHFVPSSPSKVSFAPETRVYLSDGKGTEVIPEMTSFSATTSASATTLEDQTPPEQFVPTIYRAKDIFDGHPVLMFTAEDKGVGVARYEAREYTTHGESGWHAAQSPYLINADVRRIEIKAIDYAGNERLESVRIIPSWWKPTALLLCAALLCGAIGYTFYIQWKQSR